MRYLLALLIACIALPAMAAPHHARPTQARAMETQGIVMEHEGHAPPSDKSVPAKPMPTHECIGCIPPTHGGARPVSANAFLITPRRVPARASLIAGAIPAPDTPPPKTSA